MTHTLVGTPDPDDDDTWLQLYEAAAGGNVAALNKLYRDLVVSQHRQINQMLDYISTLQRDTIDALLDYVNSWREGKPNAD